MLARWGMILGLLCVAPATFAATISAPNLSVAVDDPKLDNYPVPISISGGESIANFDLAFLVGDGGPDFGGTESIHVRSIDYLTGTIFNGKSILHSEAPALPTSTLSGTVATFNTNPGSNVAASGLLATIYLDLTGAALGSSRTLYVNVKDSNQNDITNASNASLSPLSLTFIDGSLEIVPEPNGAQLALAGLGFGILFFIFVSQKAAKLRKFEAMKGS